MDKYGTVTSLKAYFVQLEYRGVWKIFKNKANHDNSSSLRSTKNITATEKSQ